MFTTRRAVSVELTKGFEKRLEVTKTTYNEKGKKRLITGGESQKERGHDGEEGGKGLSRRHLKC